MNRFKLTLLFSVLLTITLYPTNYNADLEKSEQQVFEEVIYEIELCFSNYNYHSSSEERMSYTDNRIAEIIWKMDENPPEGYQSILNILDYNAKYKYYMTDYNDTWADG